MAVESGPGPYWWSGAPSVVSAHSRPSDSERAHRSCPPPGHRDRPVGGRHLQRAAGRGELGGFADVAVEAAAPVRAERGELHGVPGLFERRERQGPGVDPLPGGGGQRGGEKGVVEGRLAGARGRVDQYEPSAGAVAHRVLEAGAALDPLRPDLVAHDELAGAGGTAQEPLRGLVVLGGAHVLRPSSVSMRGGVPLQRVRAVMSPAAVVARMVRVAVAPSAVVRALWIRP
ncbi:hypothetical protein GCM10020254_01220 [Streptomyces goshikiensis]